MKTGFRKMDEMEMQISLISVKWAWFYTVIFLFTWTIVEFINKKQTGVPFILLISQNIIYLGLQLYLKWKFGKDEK